MLQVSHEIPDPDDPVHDPLSHSPGGTLYCRALCPRHEMDALGGATDSLASSGCFLADQRLAWREVGALAAVVLLILITGGLHLDGLGDTADGLFSYRSRERMLEIMRDSTLGTNGVIVIALAILTKYVLLCRLPDQALAVALLSSLILGRMALVWHSAVANYARASSGLATYVNQTGWQQAASATIFSFVLVTGILLIWAMPMYIAVALSLLLHVLAILPAVLFALYLKTRLGGITGDTLGATIELTELSSLFFFLLFWITFSL